MSSDRSGALDRLQALVDSLELTEKERGRLALITGSTATDEEVAEAIDRLFLLVEDLELTDKEQRHVAELRRWATGSPSGLYPG